MIEKVQFALLHYAQLALFIAGCYGLGIWPRRWCKQLPPLDRLFSVCLTICLGMGIAIVALQALGIAGLLNQFYVSVLLLLGLAGLLANAAARSSQESADNLARLGYPDSDLRFRWCFWIVIALLVVYMLPAPLHPPIDWDETESHLPQARAWASSGRLSVNEWLRYPFFPYDFNLLYAAALTFKNDIFAQLVNAATGWLTALGLYRLAAVYFNRAAAVIAALVFLYLTRGLYGTATVDLGSTMFLFFGIACVFLWRETRNFPLLCIGLFLVGVACGSKYQALTFLPFLAVLILLRERRPGRLLCLLLSFALPCAYWYVRNYLIAGDPFDPMGHRLFGYRDWNAGDMALQFADIKNAADWPSPILWPALAAVLLRSHYARPLFRPILALSLYAFVVWLVTSHYSRYLMPAYPFIALLTAIALHFLFMMLTSHRTLPALLSNFAAALLVALLGAAVAVSSIKEWGRIEVDDADRAAFLKTHIASFEIGEYLKQHPEYRLVQIGLESNLYYLPEGTIGDVFGPGRYRDFYGLSSADLANRLKWFHANAILLSKQSVEAKKITERPDFQNYFVPIKRTEKADLYRIN